MTAKISQTAQVQDFFKEVSGYNNDSGDSRVKQLMLRIVNDVARIIEDLEVTQDGFWLAVDYLNRLGGRHEAGYPVVLRLGK